MLRIRFLYNLLGSFKNAAQDVKFFGKSCGKTSGFLCGRLLSVAVTMTVPAHFDPEKNKKSRTTLRPGFVLRKERLKLRSERFPATKSNRSAIGAVGAVIVHIAGAFKGERFRYRGTAFALAA